MNEFEEAYESEYEETMDDKNPKKSQRHDAGESAAEKGSTDSKKKIRVEISLDETAKEDGFENPFDVRIFAIADDDTKEAVSLEDALKSAYKNMNGDSNLMRMLRQEVAKKFGFTADSTKDRASFETSVKKADETMSRIINDSPFRTEAPSDFNEEVIITGDDGGSGRQDSKNKFDLFV